MTAIVLAGGKLQSSESYPDLPIPLTPVASQPFLYWLTQWVKSQDFKQIVYCSSSSDEQLAAWVSHQASQDADTCFDLIGETRPLGTGGAMLHAAKRFPADLFLVVNGDSLLLSNLEPWIEKLKTTDSLDGIVVGTNLENAGRFGNLIIDSNHQLSAFQEKQPQPGKGIINAGIYLFKQSLLADLNTNKVLSLERDCFPQWLSQGKRFEVVTHEGPFIDISTQESLLKAEELIKPFCKDLSLDTEVL